MSKANKLDNLILALSGIDKSFPGVKALSQAGLSVYAGEAMALVGENGAGKSTLMKVLTGIYQKDAGEITYLGKSVTFHDPKASQLAGISIIHQELNLISELSVAENIFLGREQTNALGKIQWREMYDKADALLARLNCRFSSRQLVETLSMGDRQMVEIAKAISFDAKVIIMDEPTDALTDSETNALFKVINELKQEGRGIVYISHRLGEIFTICERITVLRDGQLIGEVASKDSDENQLIEMMVGRKLEDQYPYIHTSNGAVKLLVNNLRGPGVYDASFELYESEILGFSGLMGAGRSELMKMIYGEWAVESGSMTIDGQTLVNQSAAQAIKHGIAYISEDRKEEGLVLSMSVKHNMTLSALKQFTRLGKIDAKQERADVEEYIQAFNIKTPSQEQEIAFLSGGNQQKVSIAKGLLTHPKVLILDEPTRGVDVGAKKEIYELINTLKAQGMSIIMVSSDMPELLGMCDRIITMYQGQLTAEFSRAEATQEKLLAASMKALTAN